MNVPVTFDLAKHVYDLGICFGDDNPDWWIEGKEHIYTGPYSNDETIVKGFSPKILNRKFYKNSNYILHCPAVTIGDLMKYFFVKYDLWISVRRSFKNVGYESVPTFEPFIERVHDFDIFALGHFYKPEEAYEVAFDYILKNMYESQITDT